MCIVIYGLSVQLGNLNSLLHSMPSLQDNVAMTARWEPTADKQGSDGGDQNSTPSSPFITPFLCDSAPSLLPVSQSSTSDISVGFAQTNSSSPPYGFASSSAKYVRYSQYDDSVFLPSNQPPEVFESSRYRFCIDVITLVEQGCVCVCVCVFIPISFLLSCDKCLPPLIFCSFDLSLSGRDEYFGMPAARSQNIHSREVNNRLILDQGEEHPNMPRLQPTVEKSDLARSLPMKIKTSKVVYDSRIGVLCRYRKCLLFLFDGVPVPIRDTTSCLLLTLKSIFPNIM